MISTVFKLLGLEDGNESEVISSVYGSSFKGDPELQEIRDKKVATVIESMGDKYLLAKPVERKTNGGTKGKRKVG